MRVDVHAHRDALVKSSEEEPLRMQVAQILVELDQEIARLTEVRNLLSGAASSGTRKVASHGVGVGNGRKKRVMSAEARERIAAAQRKRWAAQKKAAK